MKVARLALVALLAVASLADAAILDPRLSGFLETAIKDPATLAKEKEDYASQGVTFEAFIYAVYTRMVEFDTTPDNSMALAQLGQYLEEKRPGVSPQLLDQMTGFYTAKENQTMMRGMFLETVRGLVTAANPVAGADAKGSPTSSTLRHAGLDGVALSQAHLVAKGDFLAVTGIGHSGWDGVSIVAPAGATQVRVKVLVPGERSLPAGAYLEILSRTPGVSPDSLGYLRIERLPTGDAYEVSGAVAKLTSPVVVALRGGYEVRRDALNSNGSAFARVPACLACGSSLNDAVADGPVLRWQWSKPSLVTILNRAAGRDTTVTCDELRLIDPTPTDGDRSSISELVVRGRDLGEIRIRSDEPKATKNRKK